MAQAHHITRDGILQRGVEGFSEVVYVEVIPGPRREFELELGNALLEPAAGNDVFYVCRPDDMGANVFLSDARVAEKWVAAAAGAADDAAELESTGLLLIFHLL
jgi:hypothetical protein